MQNLYQHSIGTSFALLLAHNHRNPDHHPKRNQPKAHPPPSSSSSTRFIRSTVRKKPLRRETKTQPRKAPPVRPTAGLPFVYLRRWLLVGRSSPLLAHSQGSHARLSSLPGCGAARDFVTVRSASLRLAALHFALFEHRSCPSQSTSDAPTGLLHSLRAGFDTASDYAQGSCQITTLLSSWPLATFGQTHGSPDHPPQAK